MFQDRKLPSPTALFLIILALSLLTKMYGFTDHWKRNDHYNWGGIQTAKGVRCLDKIPFSVSHGRMNFDCEVAATPAFANHSPAFLYVFWGFVKVFGDHEWSYRLMPLIFSTFCLILVYLIATRIWPHEPYRAVWAAFFQAFFLNMIYFGTHVDVMGEFTTTLTLLSAVFAIQDRPHRACFFALLAGFTAWNGFLQFPALLAYAWLEKRNLKTFIAWTSVSFFAGLGFMAFLKDTWNLPAFLHRKIVDPNYIESQTTLEKLTFPLRMIKTFVSSFARALGPLFAVFTFFELFWGETSKIWTRRAGQLRSLSRYHKILVLLLVGPLICAAMGPKYFMVHIFLFNFFVPAVSLICANFVWNLFRNLEIAPEKSIYSKRGLIALTLTFVALYPYGVYQSSLLHDVVNSILLISVTLAFVVHLVKLKLTQKIAAACIAIAALANFSQVVNYRNEADTEYKFCEQARAEFARTGQPIRTTAEPSGAKEMYCKGIPVIYEASPTPAEPSK